MFGCGNGEAVCFVVQDLPKHRGVLHQLIFGVSIIQPFHRILYFVFSFLSKLNIHLLDFIIFQWLMNKVNNTLILMVYLYRELGPVLTVFKVLEADYISWEPFVLRELSYILLVLVES